MSRTDVSFVGGGPYCYANSLSMMLGDDSPGPDVIEVLTGSPFGFQLLNDGLPLFDPYAWDPDMGLDAAVGLLGYECDKFSGGTREQAVQRLRAASLSAPVLVGPVEMGLLAQQPEMSGPIGADHFVVVIGADDELVTFHDPHGHPYATLPLERFVDASQADTISYGQSFTMRSGFRRIRRVDASAALHAMLPDACRWLAGRTDLPVPPGVLGGAAGLERLAEVVEAGPNGDLRGHLVYFAIRVGARRANDASVWLSRLGLSGAAGIAAERSRLIGSLQYDVMARRYDVAAATLRRMADGYHELGAAIAAGS